MSAAASGSQRGCRGSAKPLVSSQYLTTRMRTRLTGDPFALRVAVAPHEGNRPILQKLVSRCSGLGAEGRKRPLREVAAIAGPTSRPGQVLDRRR